MSSPIARLLLLVCAALAVVPATAGAATKTSIPKVSSVTPMKLKIGDRLTVKGSGFLKGKNRNTVVFKAAGQRAVFVKAESGTTTKLVVRVPAKLGAFLKLSGGSSVATRFQLRVLARKLSKSYTPAGGSPVISAPAAATGSTGTKTGSSSASSPAGSAGSAASGPADCDSDGATDAADIDDDNDLLNDGLEQHIGTTVCNADTDGDGMQDGWEYQSAIDRNAIACTDTVNGEYPVACPAVEPYPLKTTYANPLYFDNAGSDYDHDSIPTVEEYRAWKSHSPGDSLTNCATATAPGELDSAAGDGCRGTTVTNLAFPSPLGITATWTIPTAYDESHDLNGNGLTRR